MKRVLLFSIIAIAIVSISVTTISAQSSEIPSWIKMTALWWGQDQISDADFLAAMQFLIKEGILVIPEETQSQIDPPSLELDAGPSDDTVESVTCHGDARCITGTVTEVIDGDTIKVDGQSIRFALVDAPKIKYDGGQSLQFVEQLCPVGSTVTVDQDDQQLQDKYGRILGVVYCNDLNLNKELLDSGLGDLYSAFCDQSEFSTHAWAVKHGCESDDQ